jgi:hypothetical protein
MDPTSSPPTPPPTVEGHYRREAIAGLLRDRYNVSPDTLPAVVSALEGHFVMGMVNGQPTLQTGGGLAAPELVDRLMASEPYFRYVRQPANLGEAAIMRWQDRQAEAARTGQRPFGLAAGGAPGSRSPA